MAGRMIARRYPSAGNERNEPFEIFTRPQRTWPARLLGLVIRLRAEITTLAVALWLWSALTDRLPTWAAVVLVTLLGLGVAGWGPGRRYVTRRGLAVLTRHRLRATFIERRVMNYTGNLPILLWSRPTAVGERVWVLLRAGINVLDVERNLDYIASGCGARTARTAAYKAFTALIAVDVVRRDPLSGSAPLRPDFTEPTTGRPPLRVLPGRKGA
jgi:hypothetical protein